MSEVSTKSRAATAVLAFFLGTIGVHRFYIGRITTGLLLLLLGIAGWVLIVIGVMTAAFTLGLGGLGIIILGYVLIGAVGLWAFIDFILALVGALKDGKGNPVQNW